MSTLLLHLVGSMTFNRTIFPPHLYIYNDLLIYKKRSLFKKKETTISYNQLAQVNLVRGILFAQIDVITTGTDDIVVRYVSKDKATKAKHLIDQKLYHSHAKHQIAEQTVAGDIKDYEKALNRLKELVSRGEISEREFEKRKDRFLKRYY